MKQVGELAVVAQEDVQQDLQAMFRGAIRASLEVFFGTGIRGSVLMSKLKLGDILAAIGS